MEHADGTIEKQTRTAGLDWAEHTILDITQPQSWHHDNAMAGCAVLDEHKRTRVIV